MSGKARPQGSRGQPPVWLEPFLEALREDGSVTRAAKVAGIHSSTAYRYRQRHRRFARRWDRIVERQVDEIEASTLRIARHGSLEPVYYRDQHLGNIRRWYPRLMMEILRRRRPEKWDPELEEQRRRTDKGLDLPRRDDVVLQVYADVEDEVADDILRDRNGST